MIASSEDSTIAASLAARPLGSASLADVLRQARERR